MKELKVQPIRNGTVIDHIPSGKSLALLRVLRVPRPGATSTVTAAMHVPSAASSSGRKDVVKVEDRELDSGEIARVALIAPHATINIIRDYEVARKEHAELPDKVSGILQCPNLNCITNHEPVKPSYLVVSRDPVRLQCMYCDREFENVVEQIR